MSIMWDCAVKELAQAKNESFSVTFSRLETIGKTAVAIMSPREIDDAIAIAKKREVQNFRFEGTAPEGTIATGNRKE